MCVAAIYKTLEDIPELKQYIIDGECRQYEHTNVIISLLQDDNSTEDICIKSIDGFKSFKEEDNYLQNIKENPKNYLHIFKPEFVNQPFAILSCLPWMDYTGFIACLLIVTHIFPLYIGANMKKVK